MYRSLFHKILHDTFIIKRYAGHSKWQNIRHTKALKDGQRSLLFVRLCKNITIAIKENGNNSDPAFNLHLAQAVEVARKSNMPVATIQSCIKSTQLETDITQPYKVGIKGPRGSVLLVNVLAKNPKKTKQDIIYNLKKIGGVLTDQPVEGLFNRRGIIIALPPPGLENVEEVSIDHAIEAGAEEVSPPDENNFLTFFSGVSQLHQVKSNLQELKYNIEDAKIAFIPKLTVSLNDDDMDLVSRIIDKLESLPEVAEIYDNIE